MRTIFFLAFFFFGVFFFQNNTVFSAQCSDYPSGACSASACVAPALTYSNMPDCIIQGMSYCCVTPTAVSQETPTGGTGGTGGSACYDPFGTVIPCTYDPATGSPIGGTGSGTGASTTGTTVCPANFVNKSGVCFPDTTAGLGLSDISVFDLITKVMNWLLGILGVLGVIAFVISGMQYLLSAGDENLAETAKRNMTYAIIGLAIALTGLIVVNAIAGLTGAGGGTVVY